MSEENLIGRLLDAEVRDNDDDGQMQRRHERRMRAMEELGRAERNFDRLLLWSPICLVAGLIAIVVVLAIVAGEHHVH